MRKNRNASDEIPVGRWREASARRAVARWRESGLTASAFARENGLANPQRLHWWRKRLDKLDGGALAPLTFIPAQVTGAGPVTVVRLPGGVVLELADASAVPTSWVAALAAELKR
jgi:transposase-like protein